MSTSRLDIKLHDSGPIINLIEGKLYSYKDTGIIVPTYIVTYRNKSWKINFYTNFMEIISFSKAKKKMKSKFKITLQDGSLFLYNNNSNWYWYFREKLLQDFLDEYYIDKILSINNNYLDINIDDKKISDNIFIGPVKNLSSYTLDYINKKLHIEFNKFIIIEKRPKHRELIIQDQIDITDCIAEYDGKYIILESLNEGK